MGEAQKNVYELAQERLHIIFKEFDKFVNSVNKGAIFFLKAANLSFVRPPFTCNSNGELASPVIFTVSPGSR